MKGPRQSVPQLLHEKELAKARTDGNQDGYIG